MFNFIEEVSRTYQTAYNTGKLQTINLCSLTINIVRGGEAITSIFQWCDQGLIKP